MAKRNRVDDALEQDRGWRARQHREDCEARAYVQRHGLTEVKNRMVADAIDQHNKAWTIKGGR